MALNPDTANKPNFPRAKKKRNKECTITRITITLVLKMDLQEIDPASSHSQVGQPKHSAKKVVKAIEIAMLWCVLYSIQKELKSAGCLSAPKYIDADLSIFKTHLRMPDHYESFYTRRRLRHHIYKQEDHDGPISLT